MVAWVALALLFPQSDQRRQVKESAKAAKPNSSRVAEATKSGAGSTGTPGSTISKGDSDEVRQRLLEEYQAVEWFWEHSDLDAAKKHAGKAEALAKNPTVGDLWRERVKLMKQGIALDQALQADPGVAARDPRVQETRRNLVGWWMYFATKMVQQRDLELAKLDCLYAAIENDPGLRLPKETKGDQEIILGRKLKQQILVRLFPLCNRNLPRDEPTAALLCHDLVDAFWMPMLDRARKIASDPKRGEKAAEAQLAADLKQFRALLASNGASPLLAPWTDLCLASFFFDRQRFKDTDILLTRLEAVGQAQGKGAPPYFLAETLNFEGEIAAERQEFGRARAAYEKAVELVKVGGVPQQEAGILNSQGLLLLRLGDYEAAREPLQRAVERYAGDPALRADFARPRALTNLAKTFEGTDQSEEALRLHREAVKLAQDTSKLDPWTLCLCLNNLGLALYSAGNFAEARTHLTDARSKAVAIVGEGHVRVAELDVNRAWLELAEGRWNEAEILFTSALKVFDSALGESHPRGSEVRAALARVLVFRGKKGEGRRILNEALGRSQKTLERSLQLALSERDRLALVQELRTHPESRNWPGVFDTALELAPALGITPKEQHGWLMTWKGILSRHAPPRSVDLEDDPEIRQLAQQREEAIRELRAAFSGGSPSLEKQRRLHDLEEQANALERRLRERSPRFARGQAVLASTSDEVAAVIPQAAVLMDVIEAQRYRAPKLGANPVLDHRYLAFLVRHGRDPVRLEFGDARAMDRAINQFIGVLDSDDEEFASRSKEMARLIREPLIPYLEGVSTLIVCGDGLFHRLPFGAIPGAKPDQFWLEELGFVTAPSAQVLVERARGERPRAKGSLIVGGVEFGPLAERFPPLAGTLREAETVAHAFRAAHPGEGVDLLTGRDASKPRLRAIIEKRRHVHLATHGFFQGGNRHRQERFGAFGLLDQLDSGLVLAPATPKPGASSDDQFLTAEEVADFDLRGAELVVLSSCSSGLGHISSGQGVVGLLGALDRAGAGCVIASLWQIDDTSTAALMSAFYGHLWSRERPLSPPEALRAAQLDLIQGKGGQASGEMRAHPHLWAAFIASGFTPAPVGPQGAP